MTDISAIPDTDFRLFQALRVPTTLPRPDLGVLSTGDEERLPTGRPEAQNCWTMNDIQSGERTAEDASRTLGKLIYRTRQQTVTLQRMLTKRSGVCQSSISAYEQGRVEPTWSTFVRLIAAMDRRPSIDVVPVDPPPAPDHAAFLLGCLDVAIREILTLLDGIPYRFEGKVAAHLLGRPTTPNIIKLSAVGDIEDVSQRALDGLVSREVLTIRGGELVQRVQFDSYPLVVSIEIVDELRQSVQVLHADQVVNVAPWPDVNNLRL
jgi:DNA-binding XRE family transcriptional regulator